MSRSAMLGAISMRASKKKGARGAAEVQGERRSMRGRLRLALLAGALALCGWAALRLIPSRPIPAAPDEKAG